MSENLQYPKGGHIVLGVEPIGGRVHFSVHYLLNKSTDFDQTCIDTLFGGEMS